MAHDIEFFKAKTTLASTALAAALGLVLGLMSAPATAHDCARHNDQTHKHCDTGGDGEDPIVYTAELTAGAFVFAPLNPVPVTPNQRENVLRSEEDLNLDIEDSPESDTWIAMFDTCVELWDTGPVEFFFVQRGDWSIDKAGGVRVVFRHIESEGAEFRFQLIGNEFEFTADDKSFPPAPGDTSVFVLDQFAITAKSLAGDQEEPSFVGPWEEIHSSSWFPARW